MVVLDGRYQKKVDGEGRWVVVCYVRVDIYRARWVGQACQQLVIQETDFFSFLLLGGRITRVSRHSC